MVVIGYDHVVQKICGGRYPFWMGDLAVVVVLVLWPLVLLGFMWRFCLELKRAWKERTSNR